MSFCQYSSFESVIVLASEGVMNYRTRIRAIREDRDLTQKQIGEILHKSQQGYNHIEDGRAELKIDDLIRLCRFYNLSADYLIGLTDTEKKLDEY